jgi:hypothetical protein
MREELARLIQSHQGLHQCPPSGIYFSKFKQGRLSSSVRTKRQ